MNLNIIRRSLAELLISQTSGRVERSQAGGRWPIEWRQILNLKVPDAAINLSTFLVQESKE